MVVFGRILFDLVGYYLYKLDVVGDVVQRGHEFEVGLQGFLEDVVAFRDLHVVYGVHDPWFVQTEVGRGHKVDHIDDAHIFCPANALVRERLQQLDDRVDFFAFYEQPVDVVGVAPFLVLEMV